MSPGDPHDARALRERVTRIVRAALWAPSAENCQPWRFRWDGRALAVLRDDARARHALDHRGRMSDITLGGQIAYLDLAAGREGLATDIEPSPGGTGPRGEWATLRFHPTESPPDPLAAALEARCTDRRLYRGGSLSHPVFAAIAEDAARFPACRLHLLDRFSPELLSFLGDADAHAFRSPEIYQDILRWVRFSAEEVERTRDGVPWRSIGVDLPETGLLRLSRLPFAQRVIDRLHLFHGSKLFVERQVASSAALLAITLRADSRDDRVSAGHLATRAWLRLNQAGFGAQPLSVQSKPVYHLAFGGLPANTHPSLIELFSRGRGVLSRAFGYPDEEVPIWLFRAGLTSELPDRFRTRRLPVESVLDIENG